jgi:transposase
LRPRQVYDEQFKAKVALEVIKGEKTIAELASQYKVHPNQILGWKKHLLENVSELFSRKKDPQIGEMEKEMEELYKKIGKQDIELEFLKKSTRKCCRSEARDAGSGPR